MRCELKKAEFVLDLVACVYDYNVESFVYDFQLNDTTKVVDCLFREKKTKLNLYFSQSNPLIFD